MNIKKQVRFFIVFANLIVVISGCTFNGLNPERYMRWVENENNKLKIKKKINHFIYEVQFKPMQYIAIREAISEGKISKTNVNNKVRELGNYYYFTIQIGSEDRQTPMLKFNLKSREEYYERLNYFVSFAQNDLTLIDGNDTLPCLLYHFEENYNLTPFNRIVTGFEIKNKNQGIHDLTLIYNDRELNTGIVEFFIEKKALRNIPKLKI